MNQAFDPITGEICNFCYLRQEDLTAAAAALGISLPPHLLMHVQRYYRNHLQRNPSMEELYFLDGLLSLWGRSPAGVRIGGLIAEGEDATAWQDMVRKSAELGVTAPQTPTGLLTLCGKSLDRAGVYTDVIPPMLGSAREIVSRVARVPGADPLRLVLPHAAALCGATLGRAPDADMLFLFTPKGEDATAETAGFLREHRHLGICPAAFLDDAGLLPHLLSMGGVDVDYTLLPGYTPEKGLCTLLEAGRGALLFFAARDKVSALMGEAREELTLFGSLMGGNNIVLHAGASTPLMLPVSFLRAFMDTPIITLAPVHVDGAIGEVQISTDADGNLLVGVEATADATGALLALLPVAAEADADFSSACLSSVLLMPGGSAAEVMTLVLGLHRAEAETVIPAKGYRAIRDDTLPHPVLALFLRAKDGKKYTEEQLTVLKKAVADRDFPLVRKMLYKKD